MLDAISNQIEDLQTTPGRLVQSVEQASFDAWIKYYRPDENSPNVSISYYTKGAVLGFLLDAQDPGSEQGSQEPGRCDAGGVREVLGRPRVHAR